MSPNTSAEPKHICMGLSLPCPCGAEFGEPLGPTPMVGTLGIVTMSPRGAGHTGQKRGPVVGKGDTDKSPRGF